MDTFSKYRVFIESDPRTKRPQSVGYQVTPALMLDRHAALLPKESIRGRSVLDLGCCVGATGAWVLEAGAVEYVGVDIQKTFTDRAKSNLAACFPHSTWEIIQADIADFLQHNSKKYDIVCAFGILYTSLHYQEILTRMAAIADESIVIESIFPALITEHARAIPTAEHWPIVEYAKDIIMISDDQQSMVINGTMPSVAAISIFLEHLGFATDYPAYHRYKNNSALKDHRFGASFHRINSRSTKQAEDHPTPASNDMIDWAAEIPSTWTFDENIAKVFVKHARQHIPDYDAVIDLSVDFCKRLLADPLEDRIIDVGCATGETISRLYRNGCCNLIGVDNSQSMLDRCNPDHAWYVLSDQFPAAHGPYHAVLCNWTLHFMQDKRRYLEDIYQNLQPGGFLILSDKTQNQGVFLDLYHEFKYQRGVSPEEIQAKAKSLEKIMFIDPPGWYMHTLESIGFRRLNIFKASPCFTSFIAFK